MSEVANHRSCTVESRDPSQTSLYETWSGQTVTGTYFTRNNSIFPCLFHFSNAPYSIVLHLCYIITETDSIIIKYHIKIGDLKWL